MRFGHARLGEEVGARLVRADLDHVREGHAAIDRARPVERLEAAIAVNEDGMDAPLTVDERLGLKRVPGRGVAELADRHGGVPRDARVGAGDDEGVLAARAGEGDRDDAGRPARDPDPAHAVRVVTRADEELRRGPGAPEVRAAGVDDPVAPLAGNDGRARGVEDAVLAESGVERVERPAVVPERQHVGLEAQPAVERDARDEDALFERERRHDPRAIAEHLGSGVRRLDRSEARGEGLLMSGVLGVVLHQGRRIALGPDERHSEDNDDGEGRGDGERASHELSPPWTGIPTTKLYDESGPGGRENAEPEGLLQLR